MLRNHVGAIVGVCLSLAVSLAFVGCQSHTASTREPGKRIDAAGLAQETVEYQADLDKEGASIVKAQADYKTHFDAATAKLSNAAGDIARKDELKRQAVAIVGAVIPNLLSGRVADPTTYTSAFVSLLALGAAGGSLADSRTKSNTILKLRSNQTGDGAPSENAAGGVPAGGAPPLSVAKAA